MKKFFLFCSVLMCCALLCGSLTSCRAKDLFSEQILKEYEIPWLEKPAGALSESQFYKNSHYQYTAYLPSHQVFLEYCQTVLDRFLVDSYCAGYIFQSGTVGSMLDSTPYTIAAPSGHLEDYIDAPQNHAYLYFKVVYTANLLGAYNERHNSYEMKDAYSLTFMCAKEPEEDGTYYINITPHKGLYQWYFYLPKDVDE